MPLIKKDSSVNVSSTVTFEGDPEMNNVGVGAAENTESSAAVKITENVAVSRLAPALAVAKSTRMVNLFAPLLNAMPVEYNSFKRLEAKASGFVMQDVDSKISFGDTIVFEVISYQTSFVVSPGVSGAEAGSMVKYSDDGKFTKDGRSCTEYLAELLQDYPNASIKERCVVVIDLLGAPKAAKDVTEYFEAQPYQLDLSPSSRKNFYSYFDVANFSVNKGRLSPDCVQFLKAIVSEKSGTVKGSKIDWQEVAFSAAPAL